MAPNQLEIPVILDYLGIKPLPTANLPLNTMTAYPSKRFLHPKPLTKQTRVLGATAEQWDRALKGNLAQKLAEVRKLAEAAAATKDGCAVELPEHLPLDVGSTIHRKPSR